MTQPDPFSIICQWGDPALREKARAVEDFDAALGEQVAELMQVMFDADGAGLAATQVGVLRRIFVYRLGEEPPTVVVNPVITHKGEERRDRPRGLPLARPGARAGRGRARRPRSPSRPRTSAASR